VVRCCWRSAAVMSVSQGRVAVPSVQAGRAVPSLNSSAPMGRAKKTAVDGRIGGDSRVAASGELLRAPTVREGLSLSCISPPSVHLVAARQADRRPCIRWMPEGVCAGVMILALLGMPTAIYNRLAVDSSSPT
jgi:hypothetical protein